MIYIILLDLVTTSALSKCLRGKVSKEIYRCTKAIVLTGSVKKPVAYTLSRIPTQMHHGFFYSITEDIGEHVIGYLSGVSFIKYLYISVERPINLKATFRVTYNIICLPVTVYSKGISAAFYLLQISQLEKFWFGEPVHIFDGNRLWIESNFTMSDIFSHMAGKI